MNAVKLIHCEFCNELIAYGNVFVDGNKFYHNEPNSNNCATAAHMKEQGYPHQCPKCSGRGSEQVGWDEFFECYLCLGRGFLKEEPVQTSNGIWERVKKKVT